MKNIILGVVMLFASLTVYAIPMGIEQDIALKGEEFNRQIHVALNQARPTHIFRCEVINQKSQCYLKKGMWYRLANVYYVMNSDIAKELFESLDLTTQKSVKYIRTAEGFLWCSRSSFDECQIMNGK